MAQIWRLDLTVQNCWLCKWFRRNNASTANPNHGSCRKYPLRGRGAVADSTTGTTEDDMGAALADPSNMGCGDFQPWQGTPRELEPVVE